ncbi:MAG: pilin [Patescibacteria group bacterium]|jgi:hypothetical protein
MRKLILLFGITVLLTLPLSKVSAEQIGTCNCIPTGSGTAQTYFNLPEQDCGFKEAELTASCSWSPTSGAETNTGIYPTGAETKTGGLGAGKAVNLSNPLGEGNVDVKLIIGRVIRTTLGIVGSIALIIFVYGGLLWTTSAGNAEQVKKGTDTLLWAAIGLTVIFTSYTLVSFLLETITQTS